MQGRSGKIPVVVNQNQHLVKQMKGLIGNGEIFGGRMESGLLASGLPRNKINKQTELENLLKTSIQESVVEILTSLNSFCFLPVVNDLTANYPATVPTTIPLIEGQLYQVDIINNSSCSFNLQYNSQIKNSYVEISITDTFSIETVESCSLTPTNIHQVKYQYV